MQNNNIKSINFNNIFGFAKAISDSVISTVAPLAKTISDDVKSTVEPFAKVASEMKSTVGPFAKVASEMESTVKPLLEAASGDVISTAISISDSADTIRTIGKDFSEKLYLVIEPALKNFHNITSSFRATMAKLLEIYDILKGNSDSKVSFQFEEQKVYSGDSRYTKCIFGYYRSKYLRRRFYPDFGVTDFDLSVDTNFFAIYGGGI